MPRTHTLTHPVTESGTAHDNPSLKLTAAQVAARFGVTRKAVYTWIKRQGFPRPVHYGPQTPRWILGEVQAWEAAQAAKREQRRGRSA